MTLVALSFTVVCPVATLEARWPGGLAGFRRQVPNRTFCCDGTLAGAGFMAGSDAEAFVRKLEYHGLAHLRDGRCQDVGVVSADDGLLHPCSWLQLGWSGSWRTVTLSGHEQEEPVGPKWWTPQAPPPTSRVTPEVFARHFRFQGLTGKVCTFEDTRDGTPRYITALHGAALVGMLGPRLQHLATSTEGLARKLESAGAAALDEALVAGLLAVADEAERIAEVAPPLASQALFLAAHHARIARRWKVAARRWEAFTDREPTFLGGWLELTWCRNAQGLHERALESAERAVALEPTSPPALGNLAGTLHELGRDEDARRTLHEALALAPDDPVNRHLARLLRLEKA